MAATCPACGIPVVPGYVKCPRCHKPLPLLRQKSTTRDPGGGTAVDEPGGFPIIAVVIAVVVAGGIIAFFGLRGRGGTKATSEVSAPQPDQDDRATPPPPVAAPTEAPPQAPEAPNPITTAANLEATLRRLRLWSTVEVVGGTRVDIRSGVCADPQFGPTIESARASLHAAGLTKLRCLEESGAVAFERAL